MNSLDNIDTQDSQTIEVNLDEKDFKHNIEILIQSIEWDDRELFFSKYYQTHKKDPDREDYIHSVYDFFQTKLKIFADRIDDKSPPFDDLLWLQDSIQKLFEIFYTKNISLSSAFPDEATKAKFYTLMRQYVLDDHVQTLIELQEKYPKQPPTLDDWSEALRDDISMNQWEEMDVVNMSQKEVDNLLKKEPIQQENSSVLTAEEKNALLQEYEMHEEEQKKLWILPKEDNH